jgi:hypothetical protein
MRPKTNILRG